MLVKYAVIIVAAIMFLAGLLFVITTGAASNTDSAVYQFLQTMRTPTMDHAMIAFTEFGDTLIVVIVSTALLVVLLIYRAFRTAVYWMAAILGASLLNTALKAVIQRPRPIENLYTGWSNFSFPSGHSTVNYVMYGFVVIIVTPQLPVRWRTPVTAALMLMAFLVAFSRVYLGAHWVSDVLGSLALGTAWLAILRMLYNSHEPDHFNIAIFIQTLCIALLMAGAFNSYREHEANIERYKVVLETPSAVVVN